MTRARKAEDASLIAWKIFENDVLETAQGVTILTRY
jgi:hypothetical protein